MSWRIAYWRGSTRLRTATVDDASSDEVAARLRGLASKQLELEYLRASAGDTLEDPEIRSNRTGTKLWTTGREFHYTAEWFSGGDKRGGKRGR
jgi:hypothetical protein